MSSDGQGTTCRRNIAENFNHLSRVHERYTQTTDRRQTTDGRATAYSEREHEFTFAKNAWKHGNVGPVLFYLPAMIPANQWRQNSRKFSTAVSER